MKRRRHSVGANGGGFLSPEASSAIAFGGGGFLLYSYTKHDTWGVVLMVIGGLSALGAITKDPGPNMVSGRRRRRLHEAQTPIRR